MSKRVVLGFSGGIDSMTAVRLLQSEYEVEALTLNTTGDEAMLATAAERAQALGIGHHTLDVRAEFKASIIDYFTQSYMSGRTPAPCSVCNPLIKWRYLVAEADRLGVEYVATGHYFNIERYNNHLYVARADDARKDQSYYLWALSQDVLQRALTPMGHIIKEDIRQNFADRRESMGLCFLQGVTYREFITQHHPEAACAGEVVDTDGQVVGRHDGIAFYTIGQKRGFECSKTGVAIVAIDNQRNRLVVGPNADLYHHTLEVAGCNIVDKEEFIASTDVSIVIRGIGRNPEGFLRKVEPTERGYRLLLDDAAWAPAVGQPVVFYRQNRVIGGGIIEHFD